MADLRQLWPTSACSYPLRSYSPRLLPITSRSEPALNKNKFSSICFPSSNISFCAHVSRNLLSPLIPSHPRAFSSRSQPPPQASQPRDNVAERSISASNVSFALGEAQSRFFHTLPSGLKMEVIQQKANPLLAVSRPPIVFLHGSFHAAWCWAVHWLPFFAARGHDCYALSFLGQGDSDAPPKGPAGTLQSHARDVAHFIRHKVVATPILVGHSFGGIILQQYLAFLAEPNSPRQPATTAEGWEESYPNIAAAILACTVPPSGNSLVVQRYFMRKPIASIKVTLSFAAKAFAYNLSLCQETFFSKDMSPSLVQRYQKLLSKSSRMPLFDLRELNASLPVHQPTLHTTRILIVGAENDFVVDLEGLQETASFYGTSPVVLPSIAHDIMLDTAWENAAEVVCSWLKEIGL